MTLDPPIGGFTTWSAEGRGHDFSVASTSERVRGRVAREMLVAVLPRPQIASVLEAIRERAAILHLTYWIEPIEAFGTMAPAVRARQPLATLPKDLPA